MSLCPLGNVVKLGDWETISSLLPGAIETFKQSNETYPSVSIFWMDLYRNIPFISAE